MVGILSDETDPMVSVMKVRRHQGAGGWGLGGKGSTAGFTYQAWQVAEEVGPLQAKARRPHICQL